MDLINKFPSKTSIHEINNNIYFYGQGNKAKENIKDINNGLKAKNNNDQFNINFQENIKNVKENFIHNYFTENNNSNSFNNIYQNFNYNNNNNNQFFKNIPNIGIENNFHKNNEIFNNNINNQKENDRLIFKNDIINNYSNNLDMNKKEKEIKYNNYNNIFNERINPSNIDHLPPQIKYNIRNSVNYSSNLINENKNMEKDSNNFVNKIENKKINQMMNILTDYKIIIKIFSKEVIEKLIWLLKNLKKKKDFNFDIIDICRKDDFIIFFSRDVDIFYAINFQNIDMSKFFLSWPNFIKEKTFHIEYQIFYSILKESKTNQLEFIVDLQNPEEGIITIISEANRKIKTMTRVDQIDFPFNYFNRNKARLEKFTNLPLIIFKDKFLCNENMRKVLNKKNLRLFLNKEILIIRNTKGEIDEGLYFFDPKQYIEYINENKIFAIIDDLRQKNVFFQFCYECFDLNKNNFNLNDWVLEIDIKDYIFNDIKIDKSKESFCLDFYCEDYNKSFNGKINTFRINKFNGNISQIFFTQADGKLQIGDKIVNTIKGEAEYDEKRIKKLMKNKDLDDYEIKYYEYILNSLSSKQLIYHKEIVEKRIRDISKISQKPTVINTESNKLNINNQKNLNNEQSKNRNIFNNNLNKVFIPNPLNSNINNLQREINIKDPFLTNYNSKSQNNFNKSNLNDHNLILDKNEKNGQGNHQVNLIQLEKNNTILEDFNNNLIRNSSNKIQENFQNNNFNNQNPFINLGNHNLRNSKGISNIFQNKNNSNNFISNNVQMKVDNSNINQKYINKASNNGWNNPLININPQTSNANNIFHSRENCEFPYKNNINNFNLNLKPISDKLNLLNNSNNNYNYDKPKINDKIHQNKLFFKQDLPNDLLKFNEEEKINNKVAEYNQNKSVKFSLEESISFIEKNLGSEFINPESELNFNIASKLDDCNKESNSIKEEPSIKVNMNDDLQKKIYIDKKNKFSNIDENEDEDNYINTLGNFNCKKEPHNIKYKEGDLIKSYKMNFIQQNNMKENPWITNNFNKEKNSNNKNTQNIPEEEKEFNNLSKSLNNNTDNKIKLKEGFENKFIDKENMIDIRRKVKNNKYMIQNESLNINYQDPKTIDLKKINKIENISFYKNESNKDSSFNKLIQNSSSGKLKDNKINQYFNPIQNKIPQINYEEESLQIDKEKMQINKKEKSEKNIIAKKNETIMKNNEILKNDFEIEIKNDIKSHKNIIEKAKLADEDSFIDEKKNKKKKSNKDEDKAKKNKKKSNDKRTDSYKNKKNLKSEENEEENQPKKLKKNKNKFNEN